MKKYFKVYLTIMKANFSMLLAFRSNFYTHTFSALIWGAFQIITILLLTSRTGSIANWSREDLIILVIVFNIFIGLFHMIFSTSLRNLPEIIHQGELDSLITLPLSSQFLVTTRSIYYPSLIRTIVSVALLIYLLSLLNIQVSLSAWILTIFTGLLGLVLLYSIWMIVMTFCIWNTKLSNLFDFLITLNGFSRFPETMFQSLKSILIVLILPFIFAINLPALIILNRPFISELIFTLILTVFFFLISIYFWNFALKSYTSASS